MYKQKIKFLVIKIVKRVLFLMAAISISQCSVIYGYEPKLDRKIIDLINGKINS